MIGVLWLTPPIRTRALVDFLPAALDCATRKAPTVSRDEAEPVLLDADSGEASENADRLLLDRIRLGMWLVLAGIAVVFTGEIALRPGERPLIGVVQAINFAVVLAALGIVRAPARRTLNLGIGFLAYAVTIVSVGAVGIVARDATTTVVLLVGLSLVTATLLPWSPWWQLFSVVLIIATAIWTVASIVPSPRLFWLQSVGTIAPTLFSTVVIAEALRRQRDTAARAARDRRQREAALRDTNRRLEQEILDHRRTEETLRFAMRELDHRVKNTLAIVQSVADQTLRSSCSLPEFRQAFDGRLQAMAHIHSALAERRWEGLTLVELIELVVGPYRHCADSISVECDGAFVPSELVRVLGLALHELATNAAKYGALSSTSGHVAISCCLASRDPSSLRIRWLERGGPPAHEPPRRGFGMRLIEEALAYEAGGTVALQFPPDGLRCEIRIPLPSVCA
jgi:two-component sensor histidine kinase